MLTLALSDYNLWSPPDNLFYRDDTFIGKKTPSGKKVIANLEVARPLARPHSAALLLAQEAASARLAEAAEARLAASRLRNELEFARCKPLGLIRKADLGCLDDPALPLSDMLLDPGPDSARAKRCRLGRGNLGRWGANPQEHYIITRWRHDALHIRMTRYGAPLLEVLLCKKESGEWGLHGGFLTWTTSTSPSTLCS